MKVAFIGAGGVGGFLGDLMARAGHNVSFLARGPQLDALQTRGLALESSQFGAFTVPVGASDDPAELGRHDLVVVAVKLYDFAAACLLVEPLLAKKGAALTVQNGLDAPYELAGIVGPDRVLIGTISVEAAVREPGVVVQASPFHKMTVSELDGHVSGRVTTLVGQLGRAGLSVTAVADGRQALWDKAAFLIPLATLTSAGDMVVGDIQAIPELRQLFDDLCDEVASLAKADSYDVTRALNSLRRQLPSLPNFTSSMNRDFRAGRRVELEGLTGKVVRLASEKGVPAPAHAALYALLKLKAQRLADMNGAPAAVAIQ